MVADSITMVNKTEQISHDREAVYINKNTNTYFNFQPLFSKLLLAKNE